MIKDDICDGKGRQHRKVENSVSVEQSEESTRASGVFTTSICSIHHDTCHDDDVGQNEFENDREPYVVSSNGNTTDSSRRRNISKPDSLGEFSQEEVLQYCRCEERGRENSQQNRTSACECVDANIANGLAHGVRCQTGESIHVERCDTACSSEGGVSTIYHRDCCVDKGEVAQNEEQDFGDAESSWPHVLDLCGESQAVVED